MSVRDDVADDHEWLLVLIGDWECPACKWRCEGFADALVDPCDCGLSGPLRQPLADSSPGGSSRSAPSAGGVNK